MAMRILPLWRAALLLAVICLASGKEINSTEDLKKEETQGFEMPIRYEDASSSVSKSFSTSSSKSHGEGTGKGTGYGGNVKKGGGRGRGTGHGHYSSSGKGSGSGYSGPIEHGGGHKKPKIEVYSSEQGYGGQYDKPAPYEEHPHPGHGHGYGQGYDDRDSSAYGQPSYDKSEEADGHHGYDGPVHVTSTSHSGPKDIHSHTESGGSSSGETGGIKAEYVDYYPQQNVQSHTDSHSTSSGSGYGKGSGGSSKRGYRKEFRKQGYSTAPGKNPGQGQDGQKLSVYIKQLGNQPPSHLSDIGGGDYRGKNIRNEGGQGQKGYLLLPIVPGENLGNGYGTGSGGGHHGYISGERGQKVSYGHGRPQDLPNAYGGQPSSGFDTKPQIYDLAHSPGQGYSHDGGNGQHYGREQQHQQHSYSQAEGGSRGKYRDISPRPIKEQQGYYSSPAEPGSYKYNVDYEQPASKVQQNAVNYDKPPRQQQHSYREPDSTGGSLEGQLYGGGGEEAALKNKGYGSSVYDFSSQGKPNNAGGNYNSNGNYQSPAGNRGPVKARKILPNGGVHQGNIRSQEGQYGGGYPNEEVEVKPINPNAYTEQREPIEPLPEITFTPDAFFSKQLNNLKAQRQVINHGPLGVSMTYKSLGSDLTGLEGLDVLSAFDGRHPVFGIPDGRYPQQVPVNKDFGSQVVDPHIRPVTQSRFNNQRTKSIALFLQKPNQYRNPSGFSPIPNDFGGKFNFRGNSDIPSFDLYPGLNGMASTLMPLSLPLRSLF